jgi:hypothetical protein
MNFTEIPPAIKSVLESINIKTAYCNIFRLFLFLIRFLMSNIQFVFSEFHLECVSRSQHWFLGILKER